MARKEVMMRQADENRQFWGLILPGASVDFNAEGAEFREEE